MRTTSYQAELWLKYGGELCKGQEKQTSSSLLIILMSHLVKGVIPTCVPPIMVQMESGFHVLHDVTH